MGSGEVYCSEHGINYVPLIEEMCTGLDSGTLGVQKITANCMGFTTEMEVEIIQASSGSSGSSGCRTQSRQMAEHS